jgi:hypothetical protein
MRITRTALAAGALVASAALSAACTPGSNPADHANGTGTATASRGGSGATADNGATDMKLHDLIIATSHALANAKSVHVTGNIGGSDAVKFDVRITHGQGATGTATFPGGAAMGLLRLSNTVYLHGSAANWRQFGAGDAAALLADKWVKLPSKDPDLRDLLDITELSGLAKLLTPDAGTPNLPGHWPTAVVRGQRAVRIGDPKEGAIYIATTGKPYPVRIESTQGADKGTIDLAEYDRPVSIPHPPVNQIIELPAG